MIRGHARAIQTIPTLDVDVTLVFPSFKAVDRLVLHTFRAHRKWDYYYYYYSYYWTIAIHSAVPNSRMPVAHTTTICSFSRFSSLSPAATLLVMLKTSCWFVRVGTAPFTYMMKLFIVDIILQPPSPAPGSPTLFPPPTVMLTCLLSPVFFDLSACGGGYYFSLSWDLRVVCWLSVHLHVQRRSCFCQSLSAHFRWSVK